MVQDASFLHKMDGFKFQLFVQFKIDPLNFLKMLTIILNNLTSYVKIK
jgi:hypothetical protein